jgi:2-methylcitrate dehydratase PrpD
MEFAMASALIVGRAGLAELTDDFVRRPDVQALMPRVVVKQDEREDPALPGHAIYDEVIVEMQSGEPSCSVRVTKVRGGPELPLSREELWAKFEGCVQVGTANVKARDLFDALMSLERLAQMRNLPGLRTA